MEGQDKEANTRLDTFFSKMCRESPENQRLIMTQKENRGNIKVATSFSGTCDGKN